MSTIERFHCIQDSQLGPSGALYREVPLYTGHTAGPSGALYREVPLYTGHTAGPSGALYREVPLYTGHTAGPSGVRYGEVPLALRNVEGRKWSGYTRTTSTGWAYLEAEVFLQQDKPNPHSGTPTTMQTELICYNPTILITSYYTIMTVYFITHSHLEGFCISCPA